MKKLLPILLAILLIPAHCCAEIDLSSMTYDELVALRDDINLAIWQCQEWQEVEVPQGLWVVGEDIPAGKWTITYAEDVTVGGTIFLGDKLDDRGTGISTAGELYMAESIWHPENMVYFKGLTTSVDWVLNEGDFFHVMSGIVRFTPYAGKPALSFK